MKRRFTAQEALDKIMETDSEQDLHDASETEEDGSSEDAPESDFTYRDSSDSSEDEEDEEETAGPSEEWKSRNGQMMWSPTNAETLRYVPAAGVISGPTRYAVARVTTIKSCFDVFFTEEIMQLVLEMTNLQGRRSAGDWKEIDAVDLQADIGVLLLAGVYRSQNESSRCLWDDQSTGDPTHGAEEAPAPHTSRCRHGRGATAARGRPRGGRAPQQEK